MPQQQQQQQSVPSHNGPMAGAGAPQQQQQQQHQPGLGVKGPGPVGGGGGGGYGGPGGPAGDRPPQRQYVAVPTTGGRWVTAGVLLGFDRGCCGGMIAVKLCLHAAAVGFALCLLVDTVSCTWNGNAGLCQLAEAS